MTPLPRLMVAPNGARLTKADHPALPVTVGEIVECALACRREGADGLHAHARDETQQHVLDTGFYTELLAELAHRAPGFYVQITSEAAGRFSPAEQRLLVEQMQPDAVSVALREITAGQQEDVTRRFFAHCAEADIGIQHILYDEDDVAHLARLVAQGDVEGQGLMVLLVLGRYTKINATAPEDVKALADNLKSALPGVDWAACAFGPQETACLIEAMRQGGKARIGFENNRLNADGTEAADNAERVRELVNQSKPLGFSFRGDAGT